MRIENVKIRSIEDIDSKIIGEPMLKIVFVEDNSYNKQIGTLIVSNEYRNFVFNAYKNKKLLHIRVNE